MIFDKILPYEENLFFLINGSRNDFFDCLLWLFSGIKMWIPLVLFLIFHIVYKKSWTQWLLVLLGIVLVFIFCDQFSSHLVKPLFERPRPTHYPVIKEYVQILYGYAGGKYGFISGHATNSFGFAVFTALIFKNKFYNCVIFLWAIIVAYSRIYLGVHFVSDIIGGMIAGTIIGFLVYIFYKYAVRNIQLKSGSRFEVSYPHEQIKKMSAIISVYILFFSVFCRFLIHYLK